MFFSKHVEERERESNKLGLFNIQRVAYRMKG